MFLGKKDHLSNQVPLAGDRLVVLTEVSAKAIEKGRCLTLIEVGHRRQQGAWRGTMPRVEPVSEDARRRSAAAPPGAGARQPRKFRSPLPRWTCRICRVLCP